ncbi:hypothetical protein [Methylocystis rosea]|nr:hypothetical protein [Methylocystis rosea]
MTLANLYPERLWRVERRVIRSRIPVVVRRRSDKPLDWTKALKEAA